MYSFSNEEPKLDYPLIPHLKANGSEEYLIPDSDKQSVLEKMYPFEGVPNLESKLYDLHEGRLFIVKQFKVVRENGKNWLVSPYYYESGGSVIDWLPESAAMELGTRDDG